MAAGWIISDVPLGRHQPCFGHQLTIDASLGLELPDTAHVALDLDVQQRHVILIDDVLDSGRTLAFAKDLISARGAAKIETCVLLDKRAARAVSIEPDYCAFTCPDVFVVGYGMDVGHRYRELPFVGRLVD